MPNSRLASVAGAIADPIMQRQRIATRRHEKEGFAGIAPRALMTAVAAMFTACGASPAGDQGGCVSGVVPSAGVVVTDRGAVRGVVLGASRAFKGVPYAAPPVGPLRWKPPQPAACWQGERVATDFGAACVERSGAGTIGSEDCLTLNVWSPSSPPSTPLPVLFFMHPGNLVSGGSAQPFASVYKYFDGQYLAEHGPAVVVTINYRLGPFGFMAHRSFAAESDQTGLGNYGALDAIAALKWVQRNVAAFGGDPARVLMFGQSAGGFLSCTLLTSPLARGLFSSAIMESGGCGVTTVALVEATADVLAQNLGCAAAADIAGCLRAASGGSVASALPVASGNQPGVTYRPNVDGALLTQSPLATIQAGAHHHVPFITTQTAAEFSVVLPLYLSKIPTTPAEYRVAVGELISAMQLGSATVDGVIAHYPLASYPTPFDALIALTSDIGLTGSRIIARTVAASQTEPVRRAYFSRGINSSTFPPGAFHGVDLAFLFHSFAAFGDNSPDAAEISLSDATIGYWTRFAATGDPNGSGAVSWPLYDAVTDPYLEFASPIVSGVGLHTANCDYWESVLSP